VNWLMVRYEFSSMIHSESYGVLGTEAQGT